MVGSCIFFSWATVYVCAVRFWYYPGWGHIWQVKFSVLHKTVLTQTLALSSRVSRTLVLLTSWLHICGSHSPLRLLKQFSELRKVLYLGLQLYCKEYRSGPSKRPQSKVWESSKCKAFMSSGFITLLHISVYHQLFFSFDNTHPNSYDMISRCGFCLHFPKD